MTVAQRQEPAVSVATAPGRRAAIGPRRRRTGPPWWFALPAIVLFAFVVLVPGVRGVYYAFTNWDGLDQNVFGLLLALGVNSAIKSRTVLRVFLFAPAVITPVVTAYLWRNLLGPDGAVNGLLGAVGWARGGRTGWAIRGWRCGLWWA